MLNLPLCLWSSQLFDLRAPSSTDAPVLLLNPAYFLNDDFFRGIQLQDRCLMLSAWLSRNIFYITIIQQNIGILSSECKCYLHRRLCIKCFNTNNSKFCVRRVTHCRAFCKQGLPSGMIVMGSCLLLRSSTDSQCKSSSTLALLTTFSIKLYSSAAFLILRPEGL